MSDIVTEHDDGEYVRTAIIAQPLGTSFDIVSVDDERLCVINVFPYVDEEGDVAHIIVDVVDVDNKWPRKFALAFDHGERKFYHCDSSNLVSADFRL